MPARNTGNDGFFRRQWRRVGHWPRPNRVALAVVLAGAVALVLTGAAFELNRIMNPPPTCMKQGATTVLHEGPGGDCVGITDGSYPFDPSLATVEHDIRQENRQVTRAHPADYVSVVLLLPISANGGSILPMPNILEELRGAHVAQYYANRNDVAGVTPYIQLLIGSYGYQADQWSPAVRIIEHAASSRHIVAVAGLGVSLANTQSAAVRLTTDGIPVVGATITSDSFDDIKGLIRVSPSNKDEISVALSYIKSRFTRAVLAEDENGGDTYNSSLVTGFERYPDARHTIVGRELFDTTQRDHASSSAAEIAAEQVVKVRISQMTTDICGAQPATVLFAGRGRDLADLLSDLRNRPCLDKAITIISGDDVATLPFSSTVAQGLASGVTVDYAGVANPGEWAAGSGAAVEEGRRGFATFNGAFQALFPGAPLTDGDSIMAYDAVLTSVSAIRLTAQPQPAPYAVASEFAALQGERAVHGASGPLAFTADYRTSTVGSNPVGKAIPILRLRPDGTSSFVELSWPEGQPPAY